MILVVSGTPGTGKTTLAKQLATQFGLEHVELSKLIKKEKIYSGKENGCYVVDLPVLLNYLMIMLKTKKQVVIDGHLAHFLPRKMVTACFITCCPLPELRRRLTKRKYAEQKIRENLECEIFDVCFEEAKANGLKPIRVLTKQDI